MGAIYTVSSSDELYEALAKAQGGDEIRLASGDYGDLTLNSKSGFDITFDAPVTITSLDTTSPASFSRMLLEGVENLTIDNVVFDYTFSESHEIWFAPFQVGSSNNVTIKNSLFDGDVASGRGEVDDGYGFAKGLTVGGSTNITIENNEFTTWHRGLVVSSSSDVEVVGNDVHSIRSDGMDFLEVQNVLIEENYIHDFEASFSSGDHRDMIQFWTNGTDAPSTDIVIRNNILDIGEGDKTQSIFMRNDLVDRGLAGEEMYYQNILIEGNVILNGHKHGITVGETDGLIIQNNTILSIGSSDTRYSSTPTINVSGDSKNVLVTQNAVAGVTGPTDSGEFTVTDNAYIQTEDPNGIGHYSDQFLVSSLDGALADFVVDPDSMIASLGAGSSLLEFNSSPTALVPHFSVFSSPENPGTLVFDGGLTANRDGIVDPSTATFVWDFGSDTSFEGVRGEYEFAKAGWHDVSLTVIDKDGTVATVNSEIGVVGTDVLSFNQATGAFETEAYGIAETLEHTLSSSVAHSSKKALALDASGLSLSIGESEIQRFFGTDAFEMSMTLQAGQPGQSAGELMRIHGSMIATVAGDGDISIRIFPDTGGEVILESNGLAINDGQEHDISVKFDGSNDSLQLFVDGQLASDAVMVGNMPEMQSWGIYFGNPWGKQNFDGFLIAFDLDVPAVVYPEFEGTTSGFSEFNENLDEIDNSEADVSEPPSDETGQETVDTNEDAGLRILDDYVLQVADLSDNNLRGDTQVLDGDVLQLDGGKDHVRLGRLEEFEDTESLSFEVEFSKSNAMDSGMRLVWNHTHIGLSVERDGLKLYVGQPDNPFHKAISINDLGLDNTDLHKVRVITDDASDRVQVILDDELVYSEADRRDIDVSQEGARQWGWTLGSSWSHDFRGEVHGFSIEADADFLPDDMLIA